MLHGTGSIGLRPTGRPGAPDEWRDVTTVTQGEVHPIDKNFFRSDAGLRSSLGVLDDLWARSRSSLAAAGADSIRTREAAGMLAVARWSYRSALTRTETRGMHQRVDHPDTDEGQQHRILSGGLDDVWTSIDPDAPVLVGDDAVDLDERVAS